MVRLFVQALGESDCEALDGGWLAQPVNALSSLSYALVGLALIPWSLSQRGVERGVRLVVAGTAVATGIGSLMYHGPQTVGSQFGHDATFLAMLLALAVANLGAGLSWHPPVLWSVMGAALAVVMVILIAGPGLTNGLAVAALAVTVVGDVVVHRSVPRTQPWFGVAAIVSIVAVAAFVTGRSGLSWCDPESLLQPHAGWHVLGSVAIGSYAVATGAARVAAR